MYNIENCVSENKQKAIRILKKLNGSQIDFKNNRHKLNDMPFILIYDYYNSIVSYEVEQVHLVKDKDDYNIEVKISWAKYPIQITKALLFSENNVYIAIEDYYNKVR